MDKKHLTVVDDDEATKQAAALVSSEVEDIDPAAFLAEDDSDVRGYVVVKTKAGKRRLEIAALTEEEIGKAQKYATRPISKTQSKFDGNAFKQMVVAMSLSKVAGNVIMPDHLQKKLAGSITTIADEVTRLSGFSDGKESEADQVLGFSG